MVKRKPLIIGLIFACLFPSLLTWLYFVVLADHSAGWQQGVYTTGKILQFTFPLWFLAWLLKAKIKLPFAVSHKNFVGIVFGFAVVFLMISLIKSPLFEGQNLQILQSNIQAKVVGLGVTTIWSYALLGAFYSLFHSLLEEYYWRWFVYGKMRTIVRKSFAIPLSSLAFMAHHVIVLATFLGWQNPVTYILSTGIALGGLFWTWQYEKSQSLFGPWLSHLIVDAGIFYVGYQLIQF